MLTTVLLLDDDCLSLEFMKIYLEGEGFDVCTATTCAEAREVFGQRKPQVVVSDVELQDGSGIDFASYAKCFGNVKVILASGYSAEYLSRNGLNVDTLDGILTKPLDLANLKAAVQLS